ncbi:MAG: hypothetical protein EOO46_14300 [Flavobacterium sp.]|nr:MAG: hypothetical protein EOO46_14300 [Flavobacterium sp.]
MSPTQNKWYLTLDLENLSGARDLLYHGSSTHGASNTMRLSVAAQLAAYVHTWHTWSEYEINQYSIVDSRRRHC